MGTPRLTYGIWRPQVPSVQTPQKVCKCLRVSASVCSVRSGTPCIHQSPSLVHCGACVHGSLGCSKGGSLLLCIRCPGHISRSCGRLGRRTRAHRPGSSHYSLAGHQTFRVEEFCRSATFSITLDFNRLLRSARSRIADHDRNSIVIGLSRLDRDRQSRSCRSPITTHDHFHKFMITTADAKQRSALLMIPIGPEPEQFT